MNSGDREYFKQLLLSKRAELMGQMTSIRKEEMEYNLKDEDGDHSSYPVHPADQGTDSMIQEQNFLFAQRDSRLLYHIDEALEKLKKDEYGLCEECGLPIAKARLEALPHARLCITCKAKEEGSMRPDFDAEIVEY